MTSRKLYLIKVAAGLTLSLFLTLLLLIPAKATPKVLMQGEPYRVESFQLSGSGQLKVETSGGHIEVKGSSTNTVRVEMYVRKSGHNILPEDSDLGDWDIDISQSGSQVRAIAKHHSKWKLFGGNNMSISFVVYTPREISSNLDTSGGHIKVQGLSGKQQISTSGGHLELNELKGTIKARTSGGHISINDIQGDMDARTSGGHIDVRNSEGSLSVKTSGGHIELANVSGTVEASTSGGGISADLRSIAESVDLRTSGGNIRISVPDNIGLDLHLRGSYVSTNLKNFSGKVDRDEVDGKLNGGGPMITARTSGGTVSLSFN
ncbi:MAG: DUF4097 family beta strand repeat-containing protein [Balneolaceae bacterium]